MKQHELNGVLFSLLSNIVLAIVITVAGFWLTGVLTRFITRILKKSETDAGLISFLGSFLSMALKIMVVISAITQLGIPMTSFLTLIGAAGIAVGMAISGTLSNFAGGIMILVLKPFKLGDEIKAQGEQGRVSEIQIFNTYLTTADNKVVIFPNGPLANGNITNFTKEKLRRVEWTYTIAHEVSFEQAKETISSVLNSEARIQTKNPMVIGLDQITDAGMQVKVRAWVKTPDFSSVYFDVNAAMCVAFEKAQLSFAKA
ncbi:MAG: mechanosensitive ion channel family protein [Flavobacteriales bacterium]